jgi:hypothetical protein
VNMKSRNYAPQTWAPLSIKRAFFSSPGNAGAISL